ncbi:hypothetical protein CSOJ01_07047 [Colletotrichum sojae]|uniref:Uncharacterized protein n=1 Tax=Colletotrichum sojae TaxID=2175907 RepID=A0A8H6J9X1_9PEZI|nr:hypothetical protein CSOJ01_07047 [Colletotrichum sojae]
MPAAHRPCSRPLPRWAETRCLAPNGPPSVELPCCARWLTRQC